MLLSRGISKITALVIVVIVVVAIIAGALLILQQSRAPAPTITTSSPTQITTTTIPTTITTTSPSPTTTITSPTTTTSPAPTSTQPQLVKIRIGNVEIRVPPEFANFVEMARRGEVKVSIVFGYALAPEERPAFRKVINMFMQEYPGIEVVPKEYADMGTMQAEVSAVGALPKEQREQLIGKMPDVFTWAHDWIGWMADSGYLLALEDIIGYDAIDDIAPQLLPSAITAVTYQGKTYGLPYAGEAVALFINTKLVPKAPETFDELKAIMERFYNPSQGTYGIAGQVDMYHINAWLTAFGGGWYDEISRTLLINSTGTKQGLKFFISNVLRYMDPSDLGHDYQRRLFGEGKAPIFISGPWDVSYAKAALGLGNFTIAPFPKIDDKVPKPFSGFRNLYITVMADTGPKERKYAAALFVLYVALNDDALKILVDENGYVPVKISVAQYVQQNINKNPLYPIVLGFYNQLANSVPMPKDRNMQKVWGASTYLNAILQEYSKALSEGATVDEAVQRAVSVVDKNLDEAYAELIKQISS
jgi:arabinogalactan oligomer/maltooligosaccharide transport system substrate-binding protein